MQQGKKLRRYPVVTTDDVDTSPNYARLFETMSLEELADEITAGRGTPDYQQAARAEHAKRRKEKT